MSDKVQKNRHRERKKAIEIVVKYERENVM